MNVSRSSLLLLLVRVAVLGLAITEPPSLPKISDGRRLAPHECVRCDTLFSRLTTTTSGRRVQYVEMQVRGEPKSGTGMMHQWASGALYHMCEFLRWSYGKRTCYMTWTSEIPDEPRKYTNRTLTFEPLRGDAGAPCSCSGVDRVVISVSKNWKHTMPVDTSCKWWRKNKITSPTADGIPCKTYRGRLVANYNDLRGCLQEATCEITDDRPQFVVMRDPRPMAVSAYYHRLRGGLLKNVDKDEYVMAILPHICQWISTRHIVFNEWMSKQSTIFWYEEAVADPRKFHMGWLESAGLHLPESVVDEAVDAALRADFEFHTKGIDKHPGGEPAVSGRSWKNEISGYVLEHMDEMLRVWLPPELQARFLA